MSEDRDIPMLNDGPSGEPYLRDTIEVLEREVKELRARLFEERVIAGKAHEADAKAFLAAERKVAELEAERDNAIAMLETQAKLHRRAEEDKARLSEALRNVRRAIMEADPAVLTDTFWMPSNVFKGGTVVDFIDAALSGSGSGWRAMDSAPKDRTRIILAWSKPENLPPHIELGYWSDGKASWVNTYGNSFSGEPNLWFLPPLPAAPQQGGE